MPSCEEEPEVPKVFTKYRNLCKKKKKKCSGKVESTFTGLKFWNVNRKKYLSLQLMKQCINCYIQTEYVLNGDPNAEVL